MEFIFVLSIQIPLLAKYKIIWYRVLSMRKTKHRLGLVSSSASLFIAVAYLFFFFTVPPQKLILVIRTAATQRLFGHRKAVPIFLCWWEDFNWQISLFSNVLHNQSQELWGKFPFQFCLLNSAGLINTSGIFKQYDDEMISVETCSTGSHLSLFGKLK